MRRPGFVDSMFGGLDRGVFPGTRALGTARSTMGNRLGGVLTPESLFRLILAFVLATALWLFVTSKQTQGSFPFGQTIQVQSVGIGAGLTVENPLPKVHLSVGPSFEALYQSPGPIEAEVTLTGRGPGVHRVPVQVRGGIDVTGHSPRTVLVDIERKVSRRIPVKVVVVSAPPPGFSLRPGSIRVQPRHVFVSGAKTLVDPVTEAAVSLSLTGLESSVDKDLLPVLENSAGARLSRGLYFNPALVRVHAGISQLSSYKTLPVVAQLRGTPRDGLGVSSIRLSPPFLTLYGPQGALRKLRSLTTAPIDVTDLGSGRHTVTVGVREPSGVVVGVSRVRVRLVVTPVTTATTTRVALTATHVPSGDTSQLSASTISITFDAPENKVTADSREITATVNETGLPPGSHVVKAKIRAPTGVRVAVVQPQWVVITLRR